MCASHIESVLDWLRKIEIGYALRSLLSCVYGQGKLVMYLINKGHLQDAYRPTEEAIEEFSDELHMWLE